MAVKKGGLGKGLDSLIPSGAPKNKKNITEEKKQPVKVVEKVVEKIVEKPVEMKMKITEVEPNREQPRKNFDEDALLELAESIKQFGVLQPLLVQKKDDYYEIIAGERRWRAAKLAGLKEVPVIIKDFSDQEVVEIALIENIQREDLNAIEEAVAYKRLMEEFHLKQDEIAERVSKSRTTITNSLRLLNLAKADYQSEQITMEEVRLDELLLDARELVLKAHPDYHIELVFEQEAEEDNVLTVIGNSYLLTTAFVNLVENNCKYSSNRTSSVLIAYWEQWAIIRLSDNGVGMSDADKENLFKLFYRGENKNIAPGNGIGMVLTQKIIHLHKGELTVASHKDEGTTFVVKLPHI